MSKVVPGHSEYSIAFDELQKINNRAIQARQDFENATSKIAKDFCRMQSEFEKLTFVIKQLDHWKCKHIEEYVEFSEKTINGVNDLWDQVEQLWTTINKH